MNVNEQPNPPNQPDRFPSLDALRTQIVGQLQARKLTPHEAVQAFIDAVIKASKSTRYYGPALVLLGTQLAFNDWVNNRSLAATIIMSTPLAPEAAQSAMADALTYALDDEARRYLAAYLETHQ